MTNTKTKLYRSYFDLWYHKYKRLIQLKRIEYQRDTGDMRRLREFAKAYYKEKYLLEERIGY